MRCFICNVRCESELCPKCAVERAWKLDPVRPKLAPIPEVHEVPTNDMMSLAFRKVLGKRARINS